MTLGLEVPQNFNNFLRGSTQIFEKSGGTRHPGRSRNLADIPSYQSYFRALHLYQLRLHLYNFGVKDIPKTFKVFLGFSE